VAVLLWAVLAGAGLVAAQSPPPPEREPFSLASLGVKGQAIFKGFSYFQQTPNDHQNLVGEGILQLEWARRLAPWGSVKLVVDARGDTAGFAEGVTFQIPETSIHRSMLNVKEATANLRKGPVEVTVGKQVFAWGTADAFNPTDNINPYDYVDLLDNEKMGVYSAAVRLNAGPANLTVVLVPFFTPSRLPLTDSRWTPVPAASFAGIAEGRELPGREVRNMQYGARLKATFAGWDLSASYYDGFQHTPVFRQSAVEVAPGVSLPTFTPVFTRLRILGLDFSTTFGKFEVHGEGAFKLVASNGRDDRFQGMTGFNYTWDGLGLKWLDQITVIVEYGHEFILHSRPASGIVATGSVPLVGDLLADNAFRNGVIARVQFKFTEDTQLKITGLVDFGGSPSSYAQIKLTHKLTDAFHAEAGVDFLTGSATSFWGRWRDNDRFFVFLKYFF
jgi:hypothetical protein